MRKTYVVCSNAKCKFSVQGNAQTITGCPYCGSELIYGCEHCKRPLIFKGQAFCDECRKPLRP